MRRLFAITLAISLLPFGAAAKNWTDETCTVTLSTDQPDPPFLLISKDGAARLACHVDAWPIDTDIASMRCDDGTSPKMALMPSGQVLFGNHHLYPEGRFCGQMPASSGPTAPVGPPAPASPPPTIDAGLNELTDNCVTGKHRDGSSVTEGERKAACDESIARVSKLMKAGYCPSADGLGWVLCDDASPSETGLQNLYQRALGTRSAHGNAG